jgi:hypothetical protein
MSENNDPAGASIDLGTVLCALRAELAERGHSLSGDTIGMQRSLYVMGPNDLARAVFEFKATAGDAAYELMFQGAWMPSMPPRFVVLPATEENDPSLDTLEQMRAIPLLYDVVGEAVTFRDLDQLMRTHVEAD